jgi:hypothetical protein
MTDHCDSLPNKFKNKKPIAQKSASTLHERLFEKQRHFCFKAPVEVLASKPFLDFDWFIFIVCPFTAGKRIWGTALVWQLS